MLMLHSSVIRACVSHSRLIYSIEFGQHGWTARNTGWQFSDIPSTLESRTTGRSKLARSNYLRYLLGPSRVGTTELPVVTDCHAGKTIRLNILRYDTCLSLSLCRPGVSPITASWPWSFSSGPVFSGFYRIHASGAWRWVPSTHSMVLHCSFCNTWLVSKWVSTSWDLSRIVERWTRSA